MNTNTYAIEKTKQGGDYGHRFCLCCLEEMVNFDDIVAHNINKCIGNSWITKESDEDFENRFDPIIHETMSFHRWLDLKACMKQNPWRMEKSRGEMGYDPTQK